MKLNRLKLHGINLRPLLVILFSGMILVSLYQIWRINDIYAKEAGIRRQVQQFRPEVTASAPKPGTAEQLNTVVNPTVVEARTLNEDIVGWLRMEGTNIDYPFVQAEENDYYLRRDINRQYSYAGTLFMDFRSNAQFADFSSIVYGHNMLNDTMFSDIGRYNEAAFFNTNPTGWLFLEAATYQLEVFAYMEIRGDDEVIYSTDFQSEREMQRTLDYIAETALRYRELALTPKDRLAVLSTCTNDMDDMRSVIIVRLVRMQ